MLGLQEDLDNSSLKLHEEKEKVGDIEENLSQEFASKTVFIFPIISKFDV